MTSAMVLKDIFLIVFSAILNALGLYTFVNPANFAPGGIDGIAMMLQKITGVNMGYISLAINIPLLIVAWFFINKKYVIYTTLFTTMSSIALVWMEHISMYQYTSQYNAWIAVLASGMMFGVRAAIMIRIGGSTGGVAIVSSIVHQKRPYINIESIISLFCYLVIGISFFVYLNIESIVMSVAQMMIFNMAANSILKTTRNAVEAHIVTDDPEIFKEDIIKNMRHDGTIIDCIGMFTGNGKKMIVTIININQISDLMKLAKKHPDSFVYFSEVKGVRGNFKWHKKSN